MATSGTRTFVPQFAGLLGAAFTNCGIRPENVVQEHIDEALLAANLTTIAFGNRGVHQYQLMEFDVPTEAEEEEYALPAGTRDVWHAILRRDGSDTPIWPISRADYHSIPSKDTPGRPFNFYVNTETVGDSVRSVTLWPVPDRVDTVKLWLWVHAETTTKLSEDLPVGRAWYDAYGWELSWRMAIKYAPERVDMLMKQADKSFSEARSATRERRNLTLRARGVMRRGRVV